MVVQKLKEAACENEFELTAISDEMQPSAELEPSLCIAIESRQSYETMRHMTSLFIVSHD
jgi:hypothetical protein